MNVEPSKIFVTADTHFGHANIIKYCKRPFSNVTEMDEALIRAWNSIVPTDGLVFHLGDFAFATKAKAQYYRDRLNGDIVLVKGNHDPDEHDSIFMGAQDYLSFKNIYGSFVMSHYPFASWNKQGRCAIMLHGHCHGTLREKMTNRFDVGVDCAKDFKPIPLSAFPKLRKEFTYDPRGRND